MRTHSAAVKTLLATAAGLVYYEGEIPPDAPPRYVVFYLSTPQAQDASRRVSADVPKGRYTLATMYVGATPNEIGWVAEKVHGALVRKRLAVTGYTCDPFMPPASSALPRPDDSINPPAYVATDVWQFNSSPSA